MQSRVEVDYQEEVVETRQEKKNLHKHEVTNTRTYIIYILGAQGDRVLDSY